MSELVRPFHAPLATPPRRGPRPWLAALLSLLVPGLGQLYAWRVLSALLCWLASLVAGAAALVVLSRATGPLSLVVPTVLRRRLDAALLLAAGLASAACARPHATPNDEGARAAALLARAVEWAGGAGALGRARALTWEGDATVHAGGRTVRIAGRWAVQPPDSAVVATYDVTRGPSTTRSLVVAAPRGWLVSGDRFTPMPGAMLANERDEFYLYDVMRLVPLRDAAVALERVAPDSLGNLGLRARRAGRPDVELYVDPRSGRLAHLRTRIPDPTTGGATSLQDLWLSGEIAASGVRWPRTLRITMNGAPYFEMTLRALAVGERLEEGALKGPP